jgi:phage terminase small subunit
MSRELNPKQKLFCEEYVTDFNATRAYLAAGYKCTENAAAVSGSSLLRKPKIQQYLQQLQQERGNRLEITADRVLQEIAKVAFADLTDVVAFRGDEVAVKKFDEIPEGVTSAIQGVTERVLKDGSVVRAVKMHDKLRALDMLAMYLGVKSEYNSAISTLRKYGLDVFRDDQGQWQIEVLSATTDS